MSLFRPPRRRSENNERMDLKVDRLLDDLPLKVPSEWFVDRVMMDLEQAGPMAIGTLPPSRRNWLTPLHAELTNGLIATAATYLFIVTGMFERVASIGAGDWSLRLSRDVSDAVLLGQDAMLAWSQRVTQWLGG